MRIIRVLVVEDSSFFRARIKAILEHDGDIEVYLAENGLQGVDMARTCHPDVITMDIDMPEMDGITAVSKIMRDCPVPILMFSALTYSGAKATFDALAAGAVDFLPKQLTDIAGDRAEAEQILRSRIRTLGSGGAERSIQSASTVALSSHVLTHPDQAGVAVDLATKVEVVVIGTSTGGPVALEHILTRLPADFPLPIVLVQHMPAHFTGAFSHRLNQASKIEVREARDDDLLEPGVALLAPGGMQTKVVASGGQRRLRVVVSDHDMTFKPCIDYTFDSANATYPGAVLGIVLTGMGSDGCEGARHLKQGGSVVWAQDEASSVVYGMPMAVSKAGLADKVMPLEEIGAGLAAVS